MSMRGTLLIGVLSFLLFHARLFGLTIQFDYSFDTNRLVTGYSEQFDFVAAELEERIHDNLLAITVPPTSIIHPSTGEYVSVGQMDVPGDTIIVYVGAYDLPGDRFAQAHFDFSSTPNNRGQSAMDLGIWTGSISFDSLTNWQEYHIYSVLRHELLHVLGFGLRTYVRRTSQQRSVSGTRSCRANCVEYFAPRGGFWYYLVVGRWQVRAICLHPKPQ